MAHEEMYTKFVDTWNSIENFNEKMMYTRRYLEENPDMRYTVLSEMNKYRCKSDKFSREWNRSNRRSFDREYRKYDMADSCYQCDSPDDGSSFVRHHIIPISKWGPNRRVNIVTLCTRCHTYFHPWLKDKQPIIVKPVLPMWDIDKTLTFDFRLSEDINAYITLRAYKVPK